MKHTQDEMVVSQKMATLLAQINNLPSDDSVVDLVKTLLDTYQVSPYIVENDSVKGNFIARREVEKVDQVFHDLLMEAATIRLWSE